MVIRKALKCGSELSSIHTVEFGNNGHVCYVQKSPILILSFVNFVTKKNW